MQVVFLCGPTLFRERRRDLIEPRLDLGLGHPSPPEHDTFTPLHIFDIDERIDPQRPILPSPWAPAGTLDWMA